MNIRRAPIRTKLRFVILTTCAAALLVACATLFAIQYYVFRKGYREDMASVAKRVASPKGTTQAGLDVLDHDHVLDELVGVAIAAAARRGAELAEEARGAPLEEPVRLS